MKFIQTAFTCSIILLNTHRLTATFIDDDNKNMRNNYNVIRNNSSSSSEELRNSIELKGTSSPRSNSIQHSNNLLEIVKSIREVIVEDPEDPSQSRHVKRMSFVNSSYAFI